MIRIFLVGLVVGWNAPSVAAQKLHRKRALRMPAVAVFLKLSTGLFGIHDLEKLIALVSKEEHDV